MRATKRNVSIKKAAERVVYVRLTEAHARELQRLADIEAVPVSAIFRRAVQVFLSRQSAA